MSLGVSNPVAPTNPTVSSGSTSGGSSGSSSSQSLSSSFRDPSFIWGSQAEGLENLYGRGENFMSQRSGAGRALGMGVYDQAKQGWDSMMSPGMNPQLEAYSGEVQRNLERNLLPTIQGAAGGFGQMGGSRQGIAEGLALSDSNQQITDMAANLYGQDRDRQMQAIGQSGNLAQLGMGVPWYAMNQYKGLLGDPTQMQGAAGSQATSSSEGSTSAWNTGESSSVGGGGGGGGGGWDFGTGSSLW